MLFLISILSVTLFAVWLSNRDTATTMQQQETALSAPVELVFMNSWGGVDGKANALQQLLNEFMRQNPDIVVKNEAIYGDEFLPTIKTRFALGNEPDVFGLWPGSDIRSLIAAGKVADLTSLLDTSPSLKRSFNQRMWQYVTADGRIYGLPVEVIFEALFYNTGMFSYYDIKVPTTYDELLTAVKAFRAHGIVPIAYNSEAEGSYLYQNLVMMLGGKLGVEHPFTDGKVSPCYIDAMYKMRELYDLGAFPQDYLSLTSEERNNLFINKNAAMIVQGSWFISNFVSDSTVDMTTFPILTGEDPERPSIVYGMGCGIFSASKKAMDDSKKQDAALRLLLFLASKETAATLAKDTGMISNVDIASYHVAYNQLTQKGLSYILSSRALIGPPDSFISRSVWESVIIEQFPYMLEKKISPEELWQTAIASGAQEQLPQPKPPAVQYKKDN